LGSGDGDDGDDDDEKATTAARGGGKEEFSASEGKCMIGISFFSSFVSLKEEGHQFMPQRMRSFKLWHKGLSQMPCKNFPLSSWIQEWT